MATITDYFNTDQSHDMKVTSTNEVTTADGTKVPFKLFQDLAAGAVYLAFYIPPVPNALAVCRKLTERANIEVALSAAPQMRVSDPEVPGVEIPTSALRFCGRVYFYSDNALSAEGIAFLHSEGLKHGVMATYHGPAWAARRAAAEKPPAFISYDSGDRDAIARPLANELAAQGVQVWFDEFSLSVGDSLREKVEQGLRDCKHCVLVITPRFLANTGWTKREFDSVFTRELLDRKNVVLPIWWQVTQRDVYNYSPSLADRFALQWGDGVALVAGKLASKILRGAD